MSLERCYSLWQYLTLGLSCAALVFAEAPFLPDLQICLAPVLALLLLAWWVEGRWALPNWGANILGLLIAVSGTVWLAMQLNDDDFVLAHLPLLLALLPYFGPLIMATLLVKVFRDRDAGHFWHVQGWGLMQIGLGCVLDSGPAFGVLLIAYLASVLACLALHYRLSAQRGARSGERIGSVNCRVERVPNPAVDAAGLPSAPRGWLFFFTLRWTLLITGPALLLFLLTPRRDNWSWQPLHSLRTGYNRGGGLLGGEEMNLNHIGRIELDEEIAFHVYAAKDKAGRPKLDLPDDLRFRGSVLDQYERGKWTTQHQRPEWWLGNVEGNLPNLGEGQYYLIFTVQPWQAGGWVLAEPICFGSPSARLPVVLLRRPRSRFHQHSHLRERLYLREYQYCQVLPAPGGPSRTAAEDVRKDKEMDYLTSLPSKLRLPLQHWTCDLLRRLSQRPLYRLPPAVRAALTHPAEDFQIRQADWEATAGILTDYLANSGEFTYSLEITRRDRSLDPVLDFLFNVKQGHCERYAAALALMLRSLGIPARVVKGFRGCESLGGGSYVVRHSHAHAWVEILAPHKSGGGWRVRDGEQSEKKQFFPPLSTLHPPPDFDWLTLDATPSASAPAGRRLSLADLWEEVQQFCLQGWRALIVEYNGDEQAGLWDVLMSGRLLSALGKWGLAVLAIVAAWAAWLLLRRLRRPRRAAGLRSDAVIYPRLVRILARYTSLRPNCAQTPREYGTAARAFLQARPALAALAELPLRAVELFYRVRYGGRPLREGERQEIDAELDRFAEKLKQAGA